MENLFNCDGRRFSATITGFYCEGVITVEQGRIYLCQDIVPGIQCYNKKGFAYSWCYTDLEGFESRCVEGFELISKETEELQEGDWVYVSDDDPECREGQKRIFLYITSKGSNICVNGVSNLSYLNGKAFSTCSWSYIKPIPKEQPITEVTAEEALEIIAKQKGISVENLRIKK